HVANEAVGAREEPEEVTPLDRVVRLHVVEHAALADADAEREEEEAEHAADDVRRLPIEKARDEAADDGAAHAHARDDGRAVRASLLRERLAHEGDRR